MIYAKSLLNKVKFIKDYSQTKNIYVGYLGRSNYGDDLLFDIHKKINKSEYVPCLDTFGFQKIEKINDVVLGGGTIINGDIYLKALKRINKRPRYTFCSGVIDKPISKEWSTILEGTSIYTRSEESALRLSKEGLNATSWVDPGIYTSLLYPSSSLTNSCKALTFLVCPHGKYSNIDAFEAILKNCLSFPNSKVLLFASSFEDYSFCSKISKSYDCQIIKGWVDIERSNQIISASDLVISTRLHPSVVAASYGIPFIMIAYEKKQYEFINSIGAEDFIFDEKSILLNSLENFIAGKKILPGVKQWHHGLDDFIRVFGD